MYSQINPDWAGQTVVCIASGNSLTNEDIEHVRLAHAVGKCKVIVVNNNYIKAPWADHLHFCDKQFWRWHHKSLINLDMVMTTLSNELTGDMIDKGVKVLRTGDASGLSDYGDTVSTGCNSGYQAVNIAHLYGSKRILLLGYDCKLASDGKKHWFGDHPVPTPADIFSTYLKWWNKLPEHLSARGIDVINCTRDTAITSLPLGDITKEL